MIGIQKVFIVIHEVTSSFPLVFEGLTNCVFDFLACFIDLLDRYLLEHRRRNSTLSIACCWHLRFLVVKPLCSWRILSKLPRFRVIIFCASILFLLSALYSCLCASSFQIKSGHWIVNVLALLSLIFDLTGSWGASLHHVSQLRVFGHERAAPENLDASSFFLSNVAVVVVVAHQLAVFHKFRGYGVACHTSWILDSRLVYLLQVRLACALQ